MFTTLKVSVMGAWHTEGKAQRELSIMFIILKISVKGA